MFLELFWRFIGKIVFFTGTIGTKNSFAKPLTKEEEDYYLGLVRKGDKHAKEVLVKHIWDILLITLIQIMEVT